MVKPGYFVWRWKGPQGRRKIAGHSHCQTGLPGAPIALWKAVARSSSAEELSLRRHATAGQRSLPSGRLCHEAVDILGRYLHPQGCFERIEAEQTQVFVEVAELRRQDDCFYADAVGALDQGRHGPIPG